MFLPVHGYSAKGFAPSLVVLFEGCRAIEFRLLEQFRFPIGLLGFWRRALRS